MCRRSPSRRERHSQGLPDSEDDLPTPSPQMAPGKSSRPDQVRDRGWVDLLGHGSEPAGRLE